MLIVNIFVVVIAKQFALQKEKPPVRIRRLKQLVCKPCFFNQNGGHRDRTDCERIGSRLQSPRRPPFILSCLIAQVAFLFTKAFRKSKICRPCFRVGNINKLWTKYVNRSACQYNIDFAPFFTFCGKKLKFLTQFFS